MHCCHAQCLRFIKIPQEHIALDDIEKQWGFLLSQACLHLIEPKSALNDRFVWSRIQWPQEPAFVMTSFHKPDPAAWRVKMTVLPLENKRFGRELLFLTILVCSSQVNNRLRYSFRGVGGGRRGLKTTQTLIDPSLLNYEARMAQQKMNSNEAITSLTITIIFMSFFLNFFSFWSGTWKWNASVMAFQGPVSSKLAGDR